MGSSYTYVPPARRVVYLRRPLILTVGPNGQLVPAQNVQIIQAPGYMPISQPQNNNNEIQNSNNQISNEPQRGVRRNSHNNNGTNSNIIFTNVMPHGGIPIPPNVRFVPLNIVRPPQNNNNKNIANLLEEVELNDKILEKSEQKQCMICLESFKTGEKISYLPCFHFYHSPCIKKWVVKSNKCPLCFVEIKL